MDVYALRLIQDAKEASEIAVCSSSIALFFKNTNHVQNISHILH